MTIGTNLLNPSIDTDYKVQKKYSLIIAFVGPPKTSPFFPKQAWKDVESLVHMDMT
jgi:hypothetical protein